MPIVFARRIDTATYIPDLGVFDEQSFKFKSPLVSVDMSSVVRKN